MEDNKGFIGIYRDIVNHWIYKDAEYFKVWFEMIYRARYSFEPETKLIEGHLVTINRGEFVFGRKGWSKRLGVGEQRLRTLIKNLTQDNMIELVKKYNKFTIYKIINYEKYNHQPNHQQRLGNEWSEGNQNHQINHQPTTNQPPTNHQLTTQEQSSNKENKVNKDIYILSKDEEKFLRALSQIENYPLDRERDLEMYKTLEERYPELDLIEAIESWKLYKLDQPLKKNSNPRSQINTSFKNYVKWNKCLKVNKGGNWNGNNRGQSKQESDEYAGIGFSYEDLQDL